LKFRLYAKFDDDRLQNEKALVILNFLMTSRTTFVVLGDAWRPVCGSPAYDSIIEYRLDAFLTMVHVCGIFGVKVWNRTFY